MSIMDALYRVPGPRTYIDFQPPFQWVQGQDIDTLVVNLPGFRKEQIRVEIDNFGSLRVSGEQAVDGNRWKRFRRDFEIPDNCNVGEVRAKFENGNLYVMHPKFVPEPPPSRQTQESTMLPPPPSQTAPASTKDYDESKPQQRRSPETKYSDEMESQKQQSQASLKRPPPPPPPAQASTETKAQTQENLPSQKLSTPRSKPPQTSTESYSGTKPQPQETLPSHKLSPPRPQPAQTRTEDSGEMKPAQGDKQQQMGDVGKSKADGEPKSLKEKGEAALTSGMGKIKESVSGGAEMARDKTLGFVPGVERKSSQLMVNLLVALIMLIGAVVYATLRFSKQGDDRQTK